METEISYGARFFAKFVEIIAAGLATALSAYMIAQLGGLLTPGAPAPAAVRVEPSANAAKAVSPQPATPVAVSTAVEPRVTPRPEADAAAAPSAHKTGKPARDVPPRKEIGAGAAPSERSVEALARAALAKVDADQPPATEALPRSAEPPPVIAVQTPSPVATIAPPPPLVAVQIPPPPVTVIAPSVAVPPQASAPEPESPAPPHRGLLSLLQRMPDLLRPDPPASVGEAIRPPMPIGTAQD